MRMSDCMLEQLVGDSQALDRALAGDELSYKDGFSYMSCIFLAIDSVIVRSFVSFFRSFVRIRG